MSHRVTLTGAHSARLVRAYSQCAAGVGQGQIGNQHWSGAEAWRCLNKTRSEARVWVGGRDRVVVLSRDKDKNKIRVRLGSFQWPGLGLG